MNRDKSIRQLQSSQQDQRDNLKSHKARVFCRRGKPDHSRENFFNRLSFDLKFAAARICYHLHHFGS